MTKEEQIRIGKVIKTNGKKMIQLHEAGYPDEEIARMFDIPDGVVKYCTKTTIKAYMKTE